MRRSRWDRKPEVEEPIASGSQCFNQCSVNWEHHDRPQDSILSERECLNTPRPLDYSNDKRRREKKDANIEISKDKSEPRHRKNPPEALRSQNLVHPTHWSYMSNIPQIYPGSSQNTQSPFSSHTPWNQIQQGFFQNDEFHSDHVFDMKCWEQQRLPISSHLNLNEDTRKDPEKLDLSRSGHWSFNSRFPKHNDRSYEMSRRYGRYQTGNYDRNHKTFRDLRNFHTSSGLNPRYKFEGYKRPHLESPDPQTLANIWKFNRVYSDNSRPQDYSQIYRPSPGIIPNNGGFFKRFPSKFKVPLKNVKEKNPKSPFQKGNAVKKRKKREKNKDSAAELAKKKALAAAANKLKKTFLAAKKCTSKSFTKKSKDRTQSNKRFFEDASNIALMKKDIQNLSVPKSIPKEGTSLEHDIDIKFSAQEWESVGRGEGGMQNVLDLPSEVSKSSQVALEEINSDSDSVQTVHDDDDDSVKELTDESPSSEEEEDEEEEEEEGNSRSWSRGCQSPTPTRRRHVSETIKVETEVFSSHSKSRRVRSYSTSQVEEISPEKSPLKSSTSFLTSNLKNLLVKQLLSMDKKSLKELVNDPKSRKAQFMMNHFMNIHRTALSQKLNQLRFKSISFPSAVEDRNLFHSFDPVHLEDLPADLLQQVKEILDFEAEGKAQQMWEEVSLSLSDLMAGLNGTNGPFKPSGSTDPLLHADEEDEDEPEQSQHQPLTSQLSKQVLQSPPENNTDDADCQIVTPPPKLPATTITIPDSDNEIPSDVLVGHIGQNIHCPPPPPPLLISSSLNKTIPPIPPTSSPPLEPRGNFIKPSDLPHPPASPLDHPSRPPNPVPRSPPLPHLLAPSAPHPIKQMPHTPTPETSHTLPVCHPSLPPNSPIDSKRLKIGIKNKMTEESDHATGRNGCDINLQASSNFKVKQERPSPMMECGLCMHPPRSPHTPQCSFAFGIPPPSVPLMPGSPRPLGTIPPQRPVPHLPSAGVPTIFKQEQQTGSYLNLEHVNRPSSEERPKNPAPPDTTSNEPPSPLPIPPPQSSLHPPAPPRPLLFSPEEPPRPPSPPPPQHSPRIKVERQTPQFICCCMRNECERSTSSRQSADFRRSSTTPQGQLCESASLRATPHSMYKFEPPYLASLRSRTPHNGVVNMYPAVSPSSARCLAPSNAAMLQSLLPNQCLGVVGGDVASHTTQHHSRVSVGVQTVSPRPLVSSAHSLASLAARSVPSKMDQTTSTEDLVALTQNRGPPAEDAVNCVILDQKPLLVGAAESLTTRSVPTSSVLDDHVATILNKFNEFTTLSGCSITQLVELSNREREVLACFDIIEQKDRELAKERRKLSEILHRIHDMRLQRLQQHSSDARTANYSSSLPSKSPNTEGSSDPAASFQSIRDERVMSNSSKMGRRSHLSMKPNNRLQENHYMVSSSQEVSMECKSSVSPCEFFSNDSQPHLLQGERCTSTSLVDRKEGFFPTSKEFSDSDEELTPASTNFALKNASHPQYRLGRFMNRNRLNSGSTSDEYQEEKKEDANRDLSIHSNDHSDAPRFDNSSLKKEGPLFDSSSEKMIKETEKEEDMDFSHNQGTSIIKEEHEQLCNLTPNRKGSLSGSPHSPKMRNSSGSEHGYSLRSRGPPSDSFDFNSDSQMSKDALIATNEDQLEVGDDKQQLNHDPKAEGDQADDELEKEEDLEVRGDLRSSSSSRLSDNESFKKRKRKRKTRYQINKCRKKKDIANIDPMECPESSSNLEAFKKVNHSERSTNQEAMKKSMDFTSLCEEKFTVPPLHLAAVLDIKVVGNLIFTTSVDGTARLFDPVSGVVLSTYQNHTDSVTAIQIVGEPQFTVGSHGFQVITGSQDCFIHVYDGKTGVLTSRKNCTEPVRCLAYRWGYLFIGTDGGTGIKWNLKDKKLGEKIQFCGKGITRILPHVEGGRKVLVVGAKTTPIMIRDAISGLFLRTLDYVQLTMYAAVFEGNLLYTAGTEKSIFVYDYCEGDVKGHLDTQASVSDLILCNNHLHAICYDGVVRIFKLPGGELVKAIQVDSSSSLFICSALFRNKILIGNNTGQILCCQLSDLEK